MLASKLRAKSERLDQEFTALDAQRALVQLWSAQSAIRLQMPELLQCRPCVQATVASSTLPNEITAEVFSHYIDVDEGHRPLPLTWFCRAWEHSYSKIGLLVGIEHEPREGPPCGRSQRMAVPTVHEKPKGTYELCITDKVWFNRRDPGYQKVGEPPMRHTLSHFDEFK
ncbi:hypothetical protein FB45DRAFT_1006287 [Roridomyces roridus]|uniref:Uncharacterized protein n=1 Tax=Roridomyces roridus TaxID=1738132 RepID=A0AAD7BIR0_9AGAR|nr:hypothetical protein FB45DRAFT_1006287 [Roridomyces roridus]